MGYRHKLGILTKASHEVIKDMTPKQLREHFKNKNVQIYDIVDEIYELGKYYDDLFLKPYRTEVFTKDSTNAYYKTDKDIYILSQKGLLAIIENIRKSVAIYYNDLLKSSANSEYVLDNIQAKANIWGESPEKYGLFPYNLNLERNEIVNSWQYEYAIFELVRIYKSIDWHNEYLTVTAW